LMKTWNYNPDGTVLRFRSVLRDKTHKIQAYCEDGIIRNNQAVVIAISGMKMPHRWSGLYPPEIVRAVYPVNHLVLDLNRSTHEVVGSRVEYRDRIGKANGSPVATNAFLDSEFSVISAVLFGEADWINRAEPPGAEFKIVHNVTARTPLPNGWFPRGDEYWWRDGQLERHQHG
jgi:hypothetical protein